MNVPTKYAYHWRNPHTRKAKYSPGFRRFLAKHKLLTPHFSYDEARCKHCGKLPPNIRKTRDFAFALERLRKDCGVGALSIVSWYRCPTHNANIGGARQSQHMSGVAADIPVQFVRRVGTARFDSVADRIFKSGGFGQYAGGARHVDQRGRRSRWTSWSR